MWVGRPVIWRWVIVAAVFIGGIWYGYRIINENRVKLLTLPVYGDKNSDGSDHTVTSFTLTDQEGRRVTPDNFRNKIYVADFFFANCEGICPIMSDQLVRVADRYVSEPRVMILSHTVKPEEDSVPVLKQYAESRNADPEKWYFVTGDKSVIEDLARNSYLVANLGDTTGMDFVHTQFFALIDPDKRIRGFYDGTDSADVDKLIGDIGKLLKEE